MRCQNTDVGLGFKHSLGIPTNQSEAERHSGTRSRVFLLAGRDGHRTAIQFIIITGWVWRINDARRCSLVADARLAGININPLLLPVSVLASFVQPPPFKHSSQYSLSHSDHPIPA